MDDPATLTLPNGRELAYAEYGQRDGTPVFAFHGVIGSRLLWSLLDDAARERGIRLVAPERPGFGHSEFQSGRTLLDWPTDVGALADHLAIDEFGVVGLSGGGPHAAACAHAVPERLHGVALVSSVTPPETHDHAWAYERGIYSATRLLPGFSRNVFGSASWLASYARPQFRAGLVSAAGDPDRDLLNSPAGEVVVDDAVEAFRQRGRGPAHDLSLVGDDWGFDPGALDAHVAMFHGRADATVRLDGARAFGDLLGSCDLHVTDDAHYSTLLDNAGAVLDAAVGS